MNQADNDDQEKAVSAPRQGPGSLLKKARERQAVSVASVAAQLHLQSGIVDSLERDDYDSLPGPVFVQGYLRNYARLVGLREDAVVAAYQGLFPQTEEQTTLRNPPRGEGKTMHSGHGLMRLATWGIVIALAALLFFWWQTRAELEPPEPYPISQESLPEASLPADVSIPMESQDTQQAEPFVTDDPLPRLEGPGVPLPSEPREVPAAIEFRPVQTDNEVLSQRAESLSESQVSEMQPAQTEAAVVAEEAPTPVARRSKSLLFSFEGPCWTEVRSLDGKVRIIGEMRRGAERSLSGDYGPFNVVLGNASVVTLTVDGQRFDLTPFTRGKVARFTLDPDKL